MEKYRRVPKEKEPQENIAENEVRITARGTVRTYISYALGKLNAEGEGGQRTIYLKAMGRTIQKAVSIAEIIKRRVAGLHQITKLDSNTLVDTFEPTVLGLEKKEIPRTVSTITITLSKDELDVKDTGYQAPLPENLVISEEEARAERDVEDAEGRPSTRGRGRRSGRRGEGRGNRDEVGGRGRGGRGRGRGRGAGRGRDYDDDYYNEDSGRGGRRGGRGGDRQGGNQGGSSTGRGGRGRGGRGGAQGGSSQGGRGGRGGYGGSQGNQSGGRGGRGGDRDGRGGDRGGRGGDRGGRGPRN